MRTLTGLLLLIAALLVATVPAEAQWPPGGCAKSGTVIECDVQIHEFHPGGPYHVVPERIDANVGDTLKLHVTNKGNSTHNMVVCGDGKTASDKCADKWAFTNNIDPNSTKNITVESLAKGGTFYYYWLLPGHAPISLAGNL